jgi:hypothetical protein
MRRAFLALFLLGCSAHQVGNAMGAGVSTGVGVGVSVAAAVGASAYSRSQGGCYSVCQAWETCNRNTGLCESLPCNNRCGTDERCDRGGAFGDSCVKIESGLAVKAKTDDKSKSAVPVEVKIENKPQVPDGALPGHQ